ncbi:MAG: hypothetical protein HRU38_24690 [Saccharospirillaceae bacterium]|nr:hypothetical protein [Saccharospirillaceae bacterium]
MKLLSVILLFLSFKSVAGCEVLNEDGGCSSNGQFGIIEIDFDENNLINIHVITGESSSTFFDTGKWECSDSIITVEFKDETVIGEIINREITSIQFNEKKLPYFSGNNLTSFGY